MNKTWNDELIINTIRTLSMDAVQKANSGHPGTPMALAPVAYTIWNKFMKFNPSNPDWPNRDRFILSAGHASMLIYSVLYLMGYKITLEDIKNFRQMDSKTPGHPEYGIVPGIEMTTGPLGQGVGTSVGMAIAEKWLKTYFNRPGQNIIDYHIYTLASDGDMMEGLSHEAASLAGHLGLGNLIWLYDSNSITIEGSTSLTFTEDVAARFTAYGWHIQTVDDANDTDKLSGAMKEAIAEKEKPSLIIIKSHIAYGAPNKQDTAGAHGEPLGEDEIRGAKTSYGWPPDKNFYVPDEIESFTEHQIQKGKEQEIIWQNCFAEYEKKFPLLARQFIQIQNGNLPDNWETALQKFQPDTKGMATRISNSKILNSLSETIPWLLGGSADLMPSTKTKISSSGDFEKNNYAGRNFHFGIREHAMGAIVNGMALSKLRPFGATFFVFSDYMRPAIRLAALMKIPSIFIFTHDSIGLGEDGPTHQPIEHLASLRAMPDLDIIRPADANELSALWKYILETNDRPAALVLSRQDLPTIDRDKYASYGDPARGAYILADSKGTPDIILLSTGSEISLCLEAFEILKKDGHNPRVVSMPCWSLFERQTSKYRNMILPKEVKARVAIEAASQLGWERYSGDNGAIIALNHFGASAPYKKLYQKFGLTIENIVEKSKSVINQIKDNNLK